MKDAKGHGSNPRGTHADGTDRVGLPMKMMAVGRIHPTKDVFVEDPLNVPGQTQNIIDDMVNAMRAHESFPPLVVTPRGNLLDGHHRLAAYKAAGIKSVPVQVQKGYNEYDIERVQREKGLRK
jgi:ParB-like nuclease domain